MTIYTLEAGRSILRDGKRFASINRYADVSGGGAYVQPSDVDTFARDVIVAMNAHAELVHALQQAERFIVGFEDDEIQQGIPELLAQMRDAMRKARVPE